MDEIEKLRKKFDLIDMEILLLLKKRYVLSENMAQVKKSQQIPLKSVAREQQILDHLSQDINIDGTVQQSVLHTASQSTPHIAPHIVENFKSILAESLKYMKNLI
jgi:chorismate mutase